MIVEELIAKLQKYPGHYSVRAVLVGVEDADQCADFVAVTNDVTEKIVNLELDGRLE